MKVGTLSIPSSLRFSLMLIIVLMVMSSSNLIFSSPISLSAKSNNVDTSGQHSAFSLEDTASSAALKPSSSPTNVSPMDSDFTAQAPLLGPATFRSTDLVSSTAIYEIQFFTTTTGVIDKIDVTFPAGTGVAFASILERTGITGPATVTKSGTTVTLDLNTPVNVPAGTLVRFEMVDISNPPNPANYQISVTTRDPSNMPIDGPSLSPAYTIRQVSTGMIANNAVTTPKISNFAVTREKIGIGAVDTNQIEIGAVTTNEIANGAVTGDKIAGISCTGSLPSLPPGGTGQFGCSDFNADVGDDIVATWSNGRTAPSPVLINSLIPEDGSIIFGFENPGSVATAAQNPVRISYLIMN